MNRPARARRPGWLVIAACTVLTLASVAPPAVSQVTALPDAYLAPPPDPRIIPQPKALRWLDGAFEITPATRIVVGDDAEPEDLYAARELNEEIAAWGAAPLPIVRASEAGARTAGAPGASGSGPSAAGASGSGPSAVSPSGPAILIGEPWLNPLVAWALARERLRVAPSDPGPEGYVLKVTADFVVAAGADRRGTFYAVQTLRQLIRRQPARTEAAGGAGGADRGTGAARLFVLGVQVRDWPDHPIRAIHVVLDSYSDIFHTALIDRIFSRYKINMLIAESQYVRWASAPNIWHPGGATKAQASAVVAAAREHLIEPVPLIQTLGHSGWLFHNDQNLDLLEMPAEIAPARFVYNPLNPRTYEVVLPVLDEAVELFGARFVHIGHDEVRNVAPFPWSEEGRRLGFAELFVRDTLRLRAHLRSRGVRTMMWGDVLLTNEWAPEFARLPRDIVMVDWQYHPAARYPSLDRFRAWGFPVLGATWYRHDNIASFARDALRAGAGGMVRTTWTGYFGNRGALPSQYHQIYAYLVAADHFWNAGRERPSMDAVEAAARFRADWQAGRPAPAAIAGRPLDLRSAANRSHMVGGPDGGAGGWLGKGPDYDLRDLPLGLQRFAGVAFALLDPRDHGGRSIVMLRGTREGLLDLPERITVGAGFAAGEVCFLHALPYPAARFGDRVATYRVRFADGGTAEIPVRYRVNIGSWLDDPISIEHEVAWAGRTRAGIEARLSMLCWTNPDPARSIVALDLEAAGGETAPAVFAVTALDRPRRALP